jgi:hypothetical protein
MKSLRELLRREPPQETVCPRCGVPSPAGDVVCTACGWDLREAYNDRLSDPVVESRRT